MTRAKNPPADEPIVERIEDVDVATEMQGSFLEYAYSVIYSRALPDARDGLKPVQRRILYQMTEMGLRPDRGHVKSARVVGEVMGKLHPHGDTAIYDALVRMAQAFTLRVPLIDGHGNFGSLDDGPAAARYTEARLASPALAMTEGLDEDVVDFVPNYDNQLTQPEVLPAAYPNLLVNGASGIAVGMATNMAPHNLIEVVGAARHLIAHPNATLDELMEFVPGPDLPTGGTIVGLAGIKDAYATGRGSFKTRAKVRVERSRPARPASSSPSCPTSSAPRRSSRRSRTASTPRRSAASPTSPTSPTARTACDSSSASRPASAPTPCSSSSTGSRRSRTRSTSTTSHSSTAARRPSACASCCRSTSRTASRSSPAAPQYRLARRRERLHLVDGLLIAILDIDEVIQLIRSSDDTAAARARLIEVFDLSQVQAEYILELQLRRLTKFSRIELEAERDKLRAEIDELEALLASRHRIEALVSDELAEIAERFGTPRRTLLTDARPTHRRRRGEARRSRRRSRWRMSRAACSSRPPGASRASTCPSGADGAADHHRARTPQQARRHPVDARHDESRRDRRGHEPRPAHPVHARRPADAAADVGAARRRRARSATTSRCRTATRRCSRSSRSTPIARSRSARSRAS